MQEAARPRSEHRQAAYLQEGQRRDSACLMHVMVGGPVEQVRH